MLRRLSPLLTESLLKRVSLFTPKTDNILRTYSDKTVKKLLSEAELNFADSIENKGIYDALSSKSKP